MKSLLFTLLLCIGSSLASSAAAAEEIPMASVLRNSTVLHRCNAFFYDKKQLLTTASCVSCRNCQYQITLTSKSLLGDGKMYEVAEIKIHPNYTSDPDRYNAAKLILNEEVPNAVIFAPANASNLSPGFGIFNTWRFNDEMIYSMAENYGTYVHNEIYHRATGLHIRDYQIAIMSYSQVSIAHYDEGTPFYVRRAELDKFVVFGFLAKPRIQEPGKFFAFMSIPELFHPSFRPFLST